MSVSIRRAKASEADILADLISRSYQGVAERFGIDADNAPSHPSNAKPQWLRDDMGSGVRYLVAELLVTLLPAWGTSKSRRILSKLSGWRCFRSIEGAEWQIN